MFLLESRFIPFLLTALITAITVLLLMGALYALLRSKGRLVIRIRRPRKGGSLKKESTVSHSDEELPEEVLVAILTAAVYAVGENEKKRFRVVSFRRTR